MKPLFPRVAIVGRTNVGKSTLWNRLTETSRALVSDEPHTTRDRQYGRVLWGGMAFEIVDTGGMDTESDEIGTGIREQAERAIQEAQLVLFMIDAKAGVLPQDQTLAKKTQTLNKHVWLVANKADKAQHISLAHQSDVYRLSLGEPYAISAATSLGIGDLLDAVLLEIDRLGHPAIPQYEEQPLKLVLIGRPNVGKSSLVNSILGEKRVIVSSIAHTTREPQDTWLRYEDHDLVLVDTAGMRKRSHITERLEEEGIERNERAIASADIACLIFDASDDPSAQDRHLAGIIEENKKGLILVANKWDLVENKKTETTQEYEKLIRQSLPFLDWAPMVFVSAKTGQRAKQLLDMAFQIQGERFRHIDYNALNRLLKACIKAKRPLQSYGPKSPRIYDIAQTGHAPPTFLITVHGDKDNLHPGWVKFFQKRLRDKFGFIGTPIVTRVRHLPMGKIGTKRDDGPGMEAVAGKIRVKKVLVNQTRRRQKHGGRRY